MKRRARLRPRGTLALGGDRHCGLELDDIRSRGQRPLELDGAGRDGRWAAQLDSELRDEATRSDGAGRDGRWAAQVDSELRDDATRSDGDGRDGRWAAQLDSGPIDEVTRFDGDGSGERRSVLARGVGIAVDPAVAASVARVPADHGRALRALRTTRARRLAIALGIVRAARHE